ncbi:hypothetical protein GALMADRAFT_245533 [Galerina marginata CBS 339.88]|uniref:Uncharacterized protein n=1 Tax=Galerina marginata (strain CBS 339.88) TaxID=685588 RepID=A0A067THC9_GALM3|nr:hypothetical protein GALMADRAFT_245533 [Galerina marginata CBS 339.88]
MAENFQTAAPIIPVIDERLECLPTAPRDHKVKVQQYNELLEDIYQREVELSNIKSTLVDMREQIAQEARILEGTNISGLVQQVQASASHEASKSDSGDSSDAEHAVLSDSASSDKSRRDAVKLLKDARKSKAKAKSSRRSKVPDAQLGGEWDYKLELGRGSLKRGQRASDAEDSDDD